MLTKYYDGAAISYSDHPKFANVKIAVLVAGKDTDTVSVCLLIISSETEIPLHSHDPQVDSIYVVNGAGEAHVNGKWQNIAAGDYIFVPAGEEHGIRNNGSGELTLFVHHCPPLL